MKKFAKITLVLLFAAGTTFVSTASRKLKKENKDGVTTLTCFSTDGGCLDPVIVK